MLRNEEIRKALRLRAHRAGGRVGSRLAEVLAAHAVEHGKAGGAVGKDALADDRISEAGVLLLEALPVKQDVVLVVAAHLADPAVAGAVEYERHVIFLSKGALILIPD